jgi:hypothetical protein
MDQEILTRPGFKLRIDDDAFKYLVVQKGSLSFTSSNRELWERFYIDSLFMDLQSMKPALPVSCQSLLDVGSGMGGIDILMVRRYGQLRVELLDGEDDLPIMKLHRLPFNNMQVARRFLTTNGVQNIVTFNANDPTTWNSDKVDLVLSLGSWCFHYPPKEYLSLVRDKCHDGTILIIDVRAGRPDYSAVLARTFEPLLMLRATKKAWRMAYRFRP